MKHAYLIIAHNEFEQLQRLIASLDDDRNAIYIHIDTKIKNPPQFTSYRSRLTIIKNRIDVRWGHVSQIKAEYSLFKAAYYDDNYDYFHIISGVHYPLVSVNDIDEFYAPLYPASVIMPMEYSMNEIQERIGLRHLFMRNLISPIKWINKWHHLLWRAVLYPQKRLKLFRDVSFTDGKASQWCSLSRNAIKVALDREKEMIKRFNHTFCSDEYFIPAVLKSSELPLIKSDKLTYLSFTYGNASVLTESDYDTLKQSGCLFARKFTSKSLSLIKLIDTRKE